MKPFATLTAIAALGAVMSAPALAADEPASVYSPVDAGPKCVTLSTDEAGVAFSCPGHGGFGLLLAEGDLRQSVFYGHLGAWYAAGAWESFGQFNRVNDTVEWRLGGGVPYATILRWFIENMNPETGSPDEAHRGQVLVVSKVGQPGVGEACVVGYVDALANPDANELARQVADTMAPDFTCRVDEPQYHGERGPLSGDPSRTFAD